MGTGAKVGWTTDAGVSGTATEAATIDGRTVANGDSLDAAGPGTHVFDLSVTDNAGNQTQISRSFTNTGESITVPAPKDGAQWGAGTSEAVRFAVKYPVAGGQFGVFLGDTSSSALKTLGAIDGVHVYTTAVAIPVTTPLGAYQVTVAWRPSSTSDWKIVGKSGTVTVTQAQAIAVSAPAGGTTVQQGVSQTVSWSLVAPVAGGSFSIYRVDANNTWTLVKSGVPAKAGVTAYATKWVVSGPAAGGYQIAVCWSSTGTTPWQLTGTSAGFTIVTPRALHITAPAKHVSWKRGSYQTVSWTMTAPGVTGGMYKVSLVSAAGRVYTLTTTTGTSAKVRVNVPARGGYRLVVRWSGDGATYQLAARSALITIRRK